MAACRISCHYHPSSSMAMISTSSGAKKATFRLKTSAHGIYSSTHLSIAAEANKKEVFEDQLRGIVCYKDEKGEMICEGYDEGPRLGVRLAEKACFPWPVGIQVTDFIQVATLRAFEDAENLQLKDDQKRPF